MKKIENGYCDYYFLTEAGEIYNRDKDIYIKPDREHKFRLKREDNTVKKIALRPLYKLVFGRVYCNDNITLVILTIYHWNSDFIRGSP